jgi:NAD-dependent DNA ligase
MAAHLSGGNMTGAASDHLYNVYSNERISLRQIDELIGLARGVCADGVLNDSEIEFLEKWLVISADLSGQPVIARLYQLVEEMLRDGCVDEDERTQLFETLSALSDTTFELGEVLKPTTLPLCSPPPDVSFAGRRFCFTGTFNLGRRQDCERAVDERRGFAGTLTQDTDYLVIGAYVTDSWRHSSFGNKIIKAVDMRDTKGIPISIISEQHWSKYL